MLASKFYHYTAIELIMGKASPEIRKFSIYKLNLIKKKYHGLSVTESSTLEEDGKLNRIRTVLFPDQTNLYTSHINDSNNIALIVTYVNKKEQVHLSDILFTEEEFKNNRMLFKKTLETRIEQLAILLKSLNETCIDEIPLVMNDFPYIVETLFIKSGILIK